MSIRRSKARDIRYGIFLARQFMRFQRVGLRRLTLAQLKRARANGPVVQATFNEVVRRGRGA